MFRTVERSPIDSDPAALELGRSLGAPADACDRETCLYARYVRVLALLCECAPYVDDEGYDERIDEVLADAASNYPLDWRRSGRGIDISPRSGDGEPFDDAGGRWGGVEGPRG